MYEELEQRLFLAASGYYCLVTSSSAFQNSEHLGQLFKHVLEIHGFFLHQFHPTNKRLGMANYFFEFRNGTFSRS